jgi:acyl transferase domain-containing protein
MENGSQPVEVAVIGVACRFPGVSNPGEFWEILRGGEEVTSLSPTDRSQFDPLGNPTRRSERVTSTTYLISMQISSTYRRVRLVQWIRDSGSLLS